MKKIGILTLNGNYNVGNRLQNYALKKVLEKCNSKVETIWILSFKENFKRIIKNLLFKLLRMIKKYQKKVNFLSFSKKNLNIQYFLDKKNIAKRYDYIVLGSDQVWNYNFSTFNSSMLLDFSPREKNIAYAASFGVNDVTEEYRKIFENGMKNFKKISVREDRAKEIIEELSERKDVQVVLDPTMLLDKSDWDELVKKPKELKNDKFIFTYFLGEISYKRRKEIERIAVENNCEIIDIVNEKSKYYNCGPKEWLYFEKNAFLVCTDSFHSSVFAVIYDRPFIVFDREDNTKNMSSRLDTLINKLELKNRKFEDKITKENIEHNYNRAYEILKEEKNKSLSFLNKALENK